MALLGVFGIALLIWLVGGTWMLIHAARHPRGGAAAHALASSQPIDIDAAGLTGTSWIMRTRDGLDLPVMDIEGSGKGPVVVLIHSWAEAPLTMLPRASELAQTSTRILIPTLRGHDGADGACSLGPMEVSDLEVLLHTLDTSSIVIEATGFGALIAAGCKGDNRVESMRLADPWDGRGHGLRRILNAQGIPAWPIASLASLLWPDRYRT